MRRIAYALGLACAGAACGLVACADIFGIHNADVDGGFGDGGQDATPDYITHDAITLDVNTAICDGGVALADAAIWVSGRVGSDVALCGTRQSPCGSINHALFIARTNGVSVVYVDDAIFNEALTLDPQYAGFTIQGGFVGADAGWTPVCDNGLSRIYAPDDAGSAAIDIVGADGLQLRLLTVRSKANGAPGTGESVYAIRVQDTPNVLLDNVNMHAASGGAGHYGDNGSTAAPCNSFSTGNGGPGTNAGGGLAGSFDPSGYVPAYADNGTDGIAGSSNPGDGGVCQLCYTACQ